MLALIDTVLRVQENHQRRDETDREVELNKSLSLDPEKHQHQHRGEGSFSQNMIKLEKAPNITFSGDARDFTTFKNDFEKIVIPGRPDHDIGYRLKQAIPAKHRHLLSNFELSQHKEMMDKLKSKFGTKSLIVNNIVGELEKMKKSENDPAFVSFVGKIEKMLRDVEAVNHREELSNEVVMTKIEDKMPETIQDKWSDVVVDRELEDKSSSVKFTRMMKFLEKFKNKADYHISKQEASGSKSKSCVITGTTLVSHVIRDSKFRWYSRLQTSSHEWGRKTCQECHSDCSQ